MMKFTTDFLAEDYSELCWHQAKLVSNAMSVLLALAIGFTVFGVAQMMSTGRALAITLPLGILLVAICIPLICFLRKRGIIKRAERRYVAYGASDELRLEIDDDEIRQSAASGDVRLPWQDVYSVQESENCYYIFLTKRKAFYFPKRSFTSEDQKKEFFAYIDKHVPKNKIKIKR